MKSTEKRKILMALCSWISMQHMPEEHKIPVRIRTEPPKYSRIYLNGSVVLVSVAH